MGARTRGQSLTEVAVLIALLAIGAIGIVSMFGDELRLLFGGSSGALAGDGVERGGAHPPRPVRKTLKDFGYDPAGGTNGPE